MNLAFNLVALQSAIAAAVLAVSPLASAGGVSYEELSFKQKFVSSVSREQVRAEAIAARNAEFGTGAHPETGSTPSHAAFTSTASRAQIHAEAVEATRLGLTGTDERRGLPTAEQLAQIRLAGQRAIGSDTMAAVKQ
jgi:hypothetical protein